MKNLLLIAVYKKNNGENNTYNTKNLLVLLEQKLMSAYTLCESDERYQLQYRFVNPLESDGILFIDIRFVKKYMPHRRPFENF